MTSHKTSAKSPKGAKHPRRMHLVCPVCAKRFSLNYSEYRKYVKEGKRPACSRSCGAQVRWGTVTA